MSMGSCICDGTVFDNLPVDSNGYCNSPDNVLHFMAIRTLGGDVCPTVFHRLYVAKNCPEKSFGARSCS